MRMRLLAEEFLQSNPTTSLYMYIYMYIHTHTYPQCDSLWNFNLGHAADSEHIHLGRTGLYIWHCL